MGPFVLLLLSCRNSLYIQGTILYMIFKFIFPFCGLPFSLSWWCTWRREGGREEERERDFRFDKVHLSSSAQSFSRQTFNQVSQGWREWVGGGLIQWGWLVSVSPKSFPSASPAWFNEAYLNRSSIPSQMAKQSFQRSQVILTRTYFSLIWGVMEPSFYSIGKRYLKYYCAVPAGLWTSLNQAIDPDWS